MIPDNITKEHLLQALKEIDRDGVRTGRHSSTYDLIFNGKEYPPKYVLCLANKYANGTELVGFEGGIGTPAFKLLEREGFEIIPKNDPVSRLISQYKTKISSTLMIDEIYKWKLVNQYKGRPDIDAVDFKTEIESIKFGNVIYHLGVAVLHDLVRAKPEEMRTHFERLYDENQDLSHRVDTFNSETLKIYRTLVEKVQHHQDERSISTYLTLHNPDKYTFYKASFYTNYCKLLGIPVAKKNKKYQHYLELIEQLISNYIEADQELIYQVKKLIPEHYDGSNHLLLAQDILYQTLDQAVEQKYWLYAPGTNAECWDEFYNAGIMGLGWDELGDLDNYSSKEQIVAKLQALGETESSKKNDSTANYEFKNNIEIGDVIIVKKGRGVLLGYGIVTSDYYYDNTRDSFQKCRKVDWKAKGVWQVDHSLALKTLTNLTSYDSSDPKFEKYYEQLLDLMKGAQLTYNYKSDFAAWLNNKYPKSSGTASSYLKAIDMLNERVEFNIFETDDLQQLESLYAELIKEQRNIDSKYYFDEAPSYSTRGFFSASVGQYVVFLKENGSTVASTSTSHNPLNLIIYGPPGTGKTYALKNEYFEKFTSSEVTITRDEYLAKTCASLAWWEAIALAVLDLGRTKVSEILKHEFVQFKVAASNSKTVSPTIWGQLQSHTIEECEYVNVAKKSQILIFNKTNDSEWEILLDRVEEQIPDLLTLKEEIDTYQPRTEPKKRYVFTTFHQSYSYEDFIEGIKPKLNDEDNNPEDNNQIGYEIKSGLFRQIVDEAIADPMNDYAIFIDEINRGNIANIFGELITLIEDDKRIGMDNYIPAQLPYSGDEFGVPPNLHIIGTMNTADRSVEALDTALRRRFSFVEMNPEPNLLNQDVYKCNGIDLAKMLDIMNKRLEKLLDKDYRIGHSYFMTIINRQDPLPELKQIFGNKILPLLQEYFYGDWGKIGLVIGNEFVKKEDDTVKFLSDGIDEEYEEYIERPVYRFTNPKDWTLASFNSIYE